MIRSKSLPPQSFMPQSFMRRSFLPKFSLSVAIVALMGMLGVHGSAPAQTTTPAIDVRITTQATNRPVGGLITGVSVVNTGTEALTNVQLVVRIPGPPAVVQDVVQASAPFAESNVRAGVIEDKTGFWYHTIASVPAGGSVSFNVNWYSPCVGRWPFAVRANQVRVSASYQFTGAPFAGCGPDDVASPTAASWFELPWPPSVVPTSSVVPSSSTTTTVFGATTTSTLVGATSTTLVGAPVSTLVPSTAVTVPSTLPSVSSTRPPTTRPTTTRPPSTRPKVTKPPTTLEIVCKTVSGRRYCGPKSSALKPGQKKPREVKPPTTKKKKKT